MNKSIQISLVQNDKKEFDKNMFYDDTLVKKASLTSQELKDYEFKSRAR